MIALLHSFFRTYLFFQDLRRPSPHQTLINNIRLTPKSKLHQISIKSIIPIFQVKNIKAGITVSKI